MKRKIIVTGANGYIGQNVVSYLATHLPDIEIFAVDLTEGVHPLRVNAVAVDIFSRDKMEAFLESVGAYDCELIVIHLAWRDGFVHNANSHLMNLHLHMAFLEQMLKIRNVSLTVMGTMHEVGYWEGAVDAETPCRPLSCYGIAKNALRQWLLIMAENCRVSVKWLRAYYIYGDDKRNHSIFTKILEWEAQGRETFAFTTGLNKYDFISVDKLAEQIAVASLQRDYSGVINCCSGTPVALREKVDEFIAMRGLKIRPEYGKFPSRPYDSPCIYGDSSVIERILQNRTGLLCL